MDTLRAEYEQLERTGLTENFQRQASFTILQEYLPPGTRMTSGYRSPEKQLDLIIRMAQANNIPTSSNPTVEDESSWQRAFLALRAKGFIIASPTNTPHATEEDVFDMSGADLSAIEKGCGQAEKAGLLKFRKIIREPKNNAVHVEIEHISPKALNILGRRKGGNSGSTSAGSSSSSSPESQGGRRLGMLQQLQSLHDGEPDPRKKIDYDRSMKNLLDPTADSVKVAGLDDEVKEHLKEAQQLTKDAHKKELIENISLALREDRYEDAERTADELIKKHPNAREAQAVLAQIKTRRLILAAITALDSSECSECERARQMIAEALELTPNHEGAKELSEEADVCIEKCRAKRLPIIIVAVILMGGLIAGGVYLLLVSGKWPIFKARSSNSLILEGLEGACKGQRFPLNQRELIIGSKGPPAGVADIVICDAQRKISKRHCTIMHNGKQFYLLDESTNGTKINGREVVKGTWMEFRQGDRITLASEAVLWLRPQ